MGHATDQRREEVRELAEKIINAAAPGLLTMTCVATQIGQDMGLPMQSVRRYLRASVRRGVLVELSPDPAWGVTWPEAALASVKVRIAVQLYKINPHAEATRLVLVSSSSGLRPRYYGPEKSQTYLTTRRQTRLFIRRVEGVRRRKGKALAK